jgi:hypothetical protein
MSDMCRCPACASGTFHLASCAVHNGPAFPVGPCDCGAEDWATVEADQIIDFLREADSWAPSFQSGNSFQVSHDEAVAWLAAKLRLIELIGSKRGVEEAINQPHCNHWPGQQRCEVCGMDRSFF